MNRYTLAALEAMPTIRVGHMEDLKIEVSNSHRVWLSRMTKEDGADFEHEVIVEAYHPSGFWYTDYAYEAV